MREPRSHSLIQNLGHAGWVLSAVAIGVAFLAVLAVDIATPLCRAGLGRLAAGMQAAAAGLVRIGRRVRTGWAAAARTEEVRT